MRKSREKEYKTYPSVNMKNLMKEAYALYHQQMCAVSAQQEGKSDEERQACVARQSGGDYLLAKIPEAVCPEIKLITTMIKTANISFRRYMRRRNAGIRICGFMIRMFNRRV